MKPCTIRLIISIAASSNWPTKQLDVHNVFLNRDLQEQVFMMQPPGFEDSSCPTLVCHLQKVLYGFKQAPRAWFHKLSSFILQLGFQCSRVDAYLFYFHSASDIIILLIYVDDILITGSNPPWVHQIIS